MFTICYSYKTLKSILEKASIKCTSASVNRKWIQSANDLKKILIVFIAIIDDLPLVVRLTPEQLIS